MVECGIAIGGNIGDTTSRVNDALGAIDNLEQTSVLRSSSFIATAPMGQAAGGEFLNAAAIIETALAPNELLYQLHGIEEVLERRRSTHWGPRSIDLDLLFYGSQIIDSKTLVVPHPHMWYRHFVITPLTEIVPNWIHPILNEPVAQLMSRIAIRPLILNVQDQIGSLPLEEILTQLQTQESFNEVRFRLDGIAAASDEFATVTFTKLNSQSNLRSQPRHENERKIRLEINSASQIQRNLDNIVTSIIG